MILLEDILKELVESIDPIEINSNLSRKPVFYWGKSQDLDQFVKHFGEGHFPLFWLVSGEDSVAQTGYSRNAKLVIATRETRKELLNTQRISDGYSFKKVLLPLWDSFFDKVNRSSQVNIEKETLRFSKFPNYSTNDKYEVQEVWDALKIGFRIDFYEKFNC